MYFGRSKVQCSKWQTIEKFFLLKENPFQVVEALKYQMEGYSAFYHQVVDIIPIMDGIPNPFQQANFSIMPAMR